MNPYVTARVPAQGHAVLALGAMNFGKRTPKADAVRIIHRALDGGIGLVDTANAYNHGASERIVGDALRDRRAAALVATKVGAGRISGQPEGLSRKRILAACDESLGRLALDAIDVYYLHLPDPGTPIEESLDALGTLLRAGKIRSWAVSNYASWQILELRAAAGEMGLPGPVASQVLYNPLVRQLDVEYFRFAARYPIHTTVYNPLAGGLLTGAHVKGGDAPKGSRFAGNALYRKRYWRDALFDAVEDVRAVAEAEGMSLVDLVYAFALRHPGVDSVLIGPGSEAHLNAALAAREREISPDGLVRLLGVYQELVGTDASYAR